MNTLTTVTDLQPGDVIELDSGYYGVIESTPRYQTKDGRYVVWFVGDKLPAYFSADDDITRAYRPRWGTGI